MQQRQGTYVLTAIKTIPARTMHPSGRICPGHGECWLWRKNGFEFEKTDERVGAFNFGLGPIEPDGTFLIGSATEQATNGDCGVILHALS